VTALCEVPSCERPSFCRGYCRAHYARLLRHGDVRADMPVETKTTGGVGYWACHERVKAQCGPASAHLCADCGAPARDWSYDGADPAERVDRGRGYRYSVDVAHYRPRCRSCHRRATVAQARPRGQSASVVDIERAVALYRGGVATTGIARVLGTSRTAVYTALRKHGEPMRPRGTRCPDLTEISPDNQDHIEA
jgi:hypothetical protein